MKCLRCLLGTAVSALLTFAGIQPLSAQLSSLNEQPWMGYFAAYTDDTYQIGISAVGDIILTVINGKGDRVGHKLEVKIAVAIEETLPDGKIVTKNIKSESLNSEQEPTADFEKLIVTGETTGDATFELIMEQERGIVSLGGRLIDPGTLKNPLRFTIRVRFLNPYNLNRVDLTDKKEAKAFAKKIKDDEIVMKWTDNTRKKVNFEDPIDAKSEEINGPGIASAEVEISSYKDRKFIFASSGNSSLTLWNDQPEPLYNGFALNWAPDPAKDPETRARLSFQVK